MTINFLSAWFGVSLLCWLWLWIMAHALVPPKRCANSICSRPRRGVGIPIAW
jgi:hypothetical protein